MEEVFEEVSAGKYDDLVAVISNCCYVIASVHDMDLGIYDQAQEDVVKTIVHSLKVIKRCQEAILKDIQATGGIST
jgi:hypothetical protein